MKIGLFAGLIAVSFSFTAAEAGSLPQKPLPTAGLAEIAPQKDAQPARPFSAVLRYGPGTTSVCQSLSDNSSAICLLLALHMIQLSQKTISETKL
ncbi:MAG TPA: hypothetical protein VHT03_12040 [Rhizomicrobium sp.]|jgi:hypothetical protein|nr:hypothetical protein [Rhizomicrobium sp.]